MRAPAPLAQLRTHDEGLWVRLWEQAPYEHSDGPGVDTTIQALAAALLGDRDLAVEILTEGFHRRAMRPWPELVPGTSR